MEEDKLVVSVAEAYAHTRSSALGSEVIRRILLGTYALTAEYVLSLLCSPGNKGTDFTHPIVSAFDNYFLQAQRVRNLVRADFDAAFRDPNVLFSGSRSTISLDSSTSRNDSSIASRRLATRLHNGVDVIVHPSAIRTAPPLPSPAGPLSMNNGDSKTSLDSYLQDVLTVPASLAGIPSLSIPMQSNRNAAEISGESTEDWPVGVSISGQWGSEALLFHVGKTLESMKKSRP